MKNTVKKSVESFKRGLCWAWGHKLRVAGRQIETVIGLGYRFVD